MWMFSSAHLILLSRYIREIDYVELKVGYAELTQHASTGLFNLKLERTDIAHKGITFFLTQFDGQNRHFTIHRRTKFCSSADEQHFTRRGTSNFGVQQRQLIRVKLTLFVRTAKTESPILA